MADNEDNTLEAMAEEAARLIRYRFLPELIGTKLIVQSKESMGADVLTAYPQFIDRSQVGGCCFDLWPAYSRYGMTHFEIPAPEALLQQGTRSGFEVLVELGLLDPEEQPALVLLDGDEFLESLRENKPHFLLFLEDENPARGDFLQPRFPVSFKVTDACLGNTDWMWRYKHFYW